jgi:hypothetical protein
MTDPDAIARRAYELFLARGSEPGHEVDDWLQAESQLNAEAADAEEPRSSLEAPEESEPAIDQEPRSPRKRSNGSKRVARQPHTH